ncbi:hypothetical protein PIB30_076299 [Stylosanthes scabra]|uniref:Suppressor of forked domain-containing protein n=1 Tax=Stylosanthes scabra TaxID=79078 RepID=A0ABU6YRK7_9FABA|nr:hypothetical protein [Stylosanthes scabra]
MPKALQEGDSALKSSPEPNKHEELEALVSDSINEAQQNQQLQAKEAELADNPYSYDSHSQYIKLLRNMDNIEKLRSAREAMSELFPLSPARWQEWIEDELSHDTGLQDSFSSIEKLYERAVFDYMSVSLWCDYINVVRKLDPIVEQRLPAGITKARDLFETALTTAGLHVAEEYKTWEEKQGSVQDPNVLWAYQKALEMYNARVHFEEHVTRLDSPDPERLQHYLSYLEFEENLSSGTPARVQVLYERAITDFPTSPDLWLDYIRYLDKKLKVGSVVSNVYLRATKSYPWVGELWVRYLLSMERSHASEEELAEIFDKSLQCTFSTQAAFGSETKTKRLGLGD